jgi:hypothetical protein
MNSLGIDGKIYQRYLWIYCSAPLLGAIVASLFMRFVHNPNLGITLKHEEHEIQQDQEEESDEVILSEEVSFEQE